MEKKESRFVLGISFAYVTSNLFSKLSFEVDIIPLINIGSSILRVQLPSITLQQDSHK